METTTENNKKPSGGDTFIALLTLAGSIYLLYLGLTLIF